LTAPSLDQINLVCKNMEVTLQFYRALGLDIPEASVWRTEHGPHHVEVSMSDGIDLSFDSEALARAYNQGWSETSSRRTGSVIGFRVTTRQSVDELHKKLTDMGYPTSQPPFDAFWGSRYAIVEDPDENLVGIMSPMDSEHRAAPPQI